MNAQNETKILLFFALFPAIYMSKNEMRVKGKNIAIIFSKGEKTAQAIPF